MRLAHEEAEGGVKNRQITHRTHVSRRRDPLRTGKDTLMSERRSERIATLHLDERTPQRIFAKIPTDFLLCLRRREPWPTYARTSMGLKCFAKRRRDGVPRSHYGEHVVTAGVNIPGAFEYSPQAAATRTHGAPRRPTRVHSAITSLTDDIDQF